MRRSSWITVLIFFSFAGYIAAIKTEISVRWLRQFALEVRAIAVPYAEQPERSTVGKAPTSKAARDPIDELLSSDGYTPGSEMRGTAPSEQTSMPTTAWDLLLVDLPPMAEVVLTETDILEAASPLLVSDFSPASSYDTTWELRGECLLDCAKRVLFGADRRLAITMLLAANSDEARAVVKEQLRGYGPAYLEFRFERALINAPEEDTRVIMNKIGDYVVGTSLGPVVLSVDMEPNPYIHDDSLEVSIVATLTNLQLEKLTRSAASPKTYQGSENPRPAAGGS